MVQLPVDVATAVRNDAEGGLLHLVNDELGTAGKVAVELQNGQKELYAGTLQED